MSMKGNVGNSVSGEDVVTATTAEEMKADFLKRVERMYDFVKGMRRLENKKIFLHH